jgi:predicted nucleic acid-binding protein
LLIAGVTIEHQLVLTTRKVRDFMGCKVKVVNSFALV